MHHVEVSEPLGQITPRDACALAVWHRFNKQPVVSRRYPNMTFTTRKQGFNTLPLVISKSVAAEHAKICTVEKRD